MDAAEKKAYMKDLKNKKIITAEVENQINKLKKVESKK